MNWFSKPSVESRTASPYGEYYGKLVPVSYDEQDKWYPTWGDNALANGPTLFDALEEFKDCEVIQKIEVDVQPEVGDLEDFDPSKLDGHSEVRIDTLFITVGKSVDPYEWLSFQEAVFRLRPDEFSIIGTSPEGDDFYIVRLWWD